MDAKTRAEIIAAQDAPVTVTITVPQMQLNTLARKYSITAHNGNGHLIQMAVYEVSTKYAMLELEKITRNEHNFSQL